MIRRPAAVVAAAAAVPEADEAATQVTANPLEAQASEQDIHEATRESRSSARRPTTRERVVDEGPTRVRADPLAADGGNIKNLEAKKARKPPPRHEGKAPADMVLALCATFAAAAGPMPLATNTVTATPSGWRDCSSVSARSHACSSWSPETSGGRRAMSRYHRSRDRP